jgi:hypothetical protein
MKWTLPAAMTVLAFAGTSARGFELPSEITPEIRQACEADVRRLCIRPTSTFWSVKMCVMRKVMQLNGTCQARLVEAGLITINPSPKKTLASVVSD